MTREEAIKDLIFVRTHLDDDSHIAKSYDMAIKALKQEPKTGHWIECDVLKEVKCSNCRMCFRNRTDYCPNCGCRMVESKERSGKE